MIVTIDGQQRKVLTKLDKDGKIYYDENDRGSARQSKEVTIEMAGEHHITASLQNDRGTWTVRGRVYDPYTGMVRQRSKSTKLLVKNNTKRRALRMMADIVEDWTREANAEIVCADPYFSEYVEVWLKHKSRDLRANTIKSYRDYADTHILPALGKLKIREMKFRHLDVFYDQLLKRLSVNSARRIHVVVTGAFHYAVMDGVISDNIAKNVKFPAAEKFTGSTYTPEQLIILLDAAKKLGEPICAATILAACYGLRRSEVCGIRWQDIDFEKGTLSVRNTVTVNGELRIEAETTKTTKSRRQIALIEYTVPYLQQLKQTQQQAGIVLDKVCCWPDGKEALPDYISKRTQKLMKACGLPVIRLHDLRHTAASLLATKATPKQVQEFLGHEDVATTMGVYVHLLDDERKETSNMMNAILENAALCSESCSGSDSEQA